MDEERKRRIAYGKAQGLDDATIQKYELIASIQKQQQQKQAQPQQPQEQKKGPSGLKRFLVNTGALAGSIGASIGSLALAPITGGTSLAGGFAAGAGIEALRRKMLGEKQSIGASALEGGLAILPGVAKGLKGLTKAGKVAEEVSAASKAAKGAKAVIPEKQALMDTLKGAFKTPEEGGRLTKVGSNIRAEQRGIQAGEKVVGGAKGAVFNDATAAEANAAVSNANKGLIPKSVRGQVRGVQAEKEAVGQAQKAAAQASKATVNKETQAIMDDTVSKGRQKILDFDPKNEAHVKINNRYAERLANAKTPEQLLEQRKIFDTKAKATFLNPSVEQTIDKELAGVYRKATDDAIAKLAPEVKTLDKQFSLLTKAEGTMTSKASRLSPSGVKLAGTSVNGKGVGGTAIQATKEGVGKALQVAGKVTASPIVKTGLQQGIARSLTKPYLDQPTDPNIMQTQPDGSYKPANGATNDTFDINDPSAQLPPVDQLTAYFTKNGITDPQQMFDALNASEQQAPQDVPAENPLGVSSSELFKQAYQLRLAGDTKGSADILNFAKVAQDFETAAAKASGKDAKGKPLGAAQAKDVQNASSGLRAIDTLEGILKSDPSARTKTALPFRGVVGGAGNRILGTGQLENARKEIADVITRLRTGAAINASEEAFYKSQLPEAFDNEATVQQKLKQLKDLFNGLSNPTYFSDGSGNSGTSLEDISQLFNQGATQ